MDVTNACESSPGPNVIESPTNFKTGGNSLTISTGEVSDRVKQARNPTSSKGENTKLHAKNGKLSGKRKMSDYAPTTKKEVKKASKKRVAVASPSAVECFTDTNENSSGIQADEISKIMNTTSNPTNSDGENAKKPAKERKLSRKRNKPYHTPTSKRETKKYSRKRNGGSVVASPSAIEGFYYVNTDEDSLGIQVDEVSNNPENSDGKNAKMPAKEGKLSSRRKKRDDPPTMETEVRKTLKSNRATSAASPSAIACPSTLITDHNIMGTQTYEVSSKMKTTNNPASSEVNNTKKTSENGKHLVLRNKPNILPMSEMLKAFKDLRQQNEASVESRTSVIESSTKLKTEEDSLGIPYIEVSKKKKTTNNAASSDVKNTKTPAGNRKILQKKKTDHSSTSKTVVVKSNKDLENKNADSVVDGTRVVESVPNLKADEIFKKIQADKVSSKIQKTNNPVSSKKKTSNVPAKRGKLSLKRKIPDYPPTSQMVMEAIKALRKRNGVSVDAILEYAESKYRVNAKLVKRYVTRCINSAVEKGIIEQLGGAGNDGGRFKIKTAEKVAKDGKKRKK